MRALCEKCAESSLYAKWSGGLVSKGRRVAHAYSAYSILLRNKTQQVTSTIRGAEKAEGLKNFVKLLTWPVEGRGQLDVAELPTGSSFVT